MSLTSLLSAMRLRALAGYSFTRGEEYARTGRVAECRLEDDQLVGIVTGSEDYRVTVRADAHQLWADCTCPVGGRGQLCKHAVALVLHHLRSGEEAAAPASAPRDAGPVFSTLRELDLFVTEHGIHHALVIPAEVLGPVLHETVPGMRGSLPYLLARWALREVACLETVARFVGVQGLRRPIAEAAYGYLQQAAADAARARDEEGRPAEPPSDAALHALWARLRDARAPVRRQATPRSRATREQCSLTFDPKLVRLVWTEPVPQSLVRGTFTRTEIETTLVLTPATELRCTCEKSACTHMLGLLDATLDLIADPAQSRLARQIADDMLRPSWQRALAELAASENLPKPPPEVELWWQIEGELGDYKIVPVLKKRLKKGGWSSGTATTATRLLQNHADVLSDQELLVAQYVEGWEVLRSGMMPPRAFMMLVGHPRIVSGDDPDTLLTVRRVPLGFAAHPAGDGVKLEPTVDGARISPRLLNPLLEMYDDKEPLMLLELEQARFLVIDVSPEARRLWTVLSKYGDTFPAEGQDQLMERLAHLDKALPIAVPETLLGRRLTDAPIVVVRLRLTLEGTLELEPFIRPAAGAPLYPPGVGPRDVLVQRGGERTYARRDLGSELPLVASLLARLPLADAEEGPELVYHLRDVDAALALVEAVQDPPEGLEAEWVDKKQSIVKSGGVAALSISVQRKRDWFGVDGDLKVEGGRIELAVLLDAARQQRRFVRLDDSRWVDLSAEVRQRLTAIADRTFATKNALELSPGAVPVIHALAKSGAQVETAPAWQLLAERLVVAERLRPKPPAALEATLRPYQVEGHAWLARLAAWGAGACLADDMGLGKTIQAIALLLDRAKQGPAIVLAPTSVTLNWVDELRRFAPTLRPVVYGEASDRAACLAGLKKNDILIVSYGLLVRDAEALAARTFSTLVMDEAQALKNSATRRHKAARALDATFRLAMSGTPLENHLGELWALFAIVFPGLLGSFEQFRTRFGLPIERDRNPEARAALSRLIRPFLLRRTKDEVAQELPPRIEIMVPIALSSDEAGLYEDARLAAVASIGNKGSMRDEQRRFQVLAALTRLRLLASHPRLYEPSSPIASSKMQRMVELVDELRSEGHRVLVFSQFTAHLALAQEALDKAGVHYLYLDGSTPTRTRAELIARFQAGEGEAFLISLKAGGTGINLTAADYVIHLDPWWNPAVEDQATDRAHRIGQTRPVTVYRLVSRGTVEEKILSMHGDKRALVAGVLDGTSAAARLTTRDLLALVGDDSAIRHAAPAPDELTN